MNATRSPSWRASATTLMLMLVVLAGCTTAGPDAPEQDGRHDTVNRLSWNVWPADAMFMKIEVACACPGKSVELGGRLQASWTSQPAQDGPTSNVREQVHAEWAQWAIYKDLDDPRETGHAGVWRNWATGVGTAYSYAAMVDAGVGPAPEATVLQAGRGGEVFVTYTQEFPLIVPLDGEDLHLVMVATNGTGLRREPQINITMHVPPEAQVTTTIGSRTALAYDEPTFGRGQGLDLSYPARTHVRNFGPSELAVEHQGTLSYGFMPWIPVPGGTREAVYSIEAADHGYRVRYEDMDGNADYECLEGCEGLGMSYAANTGFAPPGTTTFRIEEARCLSDSACRAAIVGVDLGDAEVLPPSAWARCARI